MKIFRAKDHLTAAELKNTGRCSAMALAASRMAIDDSGIKRQLLKGDRTSVVVGTTMGEADVIEELDQAWIANGPRALSRSRAATIQSLTTPLCSISRLWGTSTGLCGSAGGTKPLTG